MVTYMVDPIAIGVKWMGIGLGIASCTIVHAARCSLQATLVRNALIEVIVESRILDLRRGIMLRIPPTASSPCPSTVTFQAIVYAYHFSLTYMPVLLTHLLLIHFLCLFILSYSSMTQRLLLDTF